jgi:O-antigen/teichoic acid export membrane protein
LQNKYGQLSIKKIFIFWLPLAATWLMMSVEGPFLSALIARLDEPKYNLAAYGVAFALALIIEAPVIMIMSASTALVRDNHSFNKLKKFTYCLIAGISVLIMILVIPPVFYFIAEDLIGLPQHVAYLTHIATIIMLPWPAAIGYRRFYQGVLIRNNLTRRVAYGTIVRLLTMVITAFIIFFYFDVPGVIVGASALSIAVIAEAIASRFMTSGVIKKISLIPPLDENRLTYKEIYKFYYPLALMSLLSLGVQPFVTFFVVQSRMAIESLAVLPVITSFVFIFRALGLSYQEVIIAKIGDDKSGYVQLRNFALILGGLLSFTLMLIAFTPLANIWFMDVSGLSKMLAKFAGTPLKIMAIIPALTVLISFQRSILVNNKNTGPITWGTAIEFVMILIVLFLSINIFSLVGAIAATISIVIGRAAANIYLIPHVNKSKK